MDMAARRASRKAAWRLIPFLILCFFIAFLDRVNVGFAALTMNKELGLTAEMFGFGAGIFFFGYFIFEVPSNLILERVGARRWIARIMISWGVIAASFAFVPSISVMLQSFGFSFFDNARTFYFMRFIFGAAEAGFVPGATPPAAVTTLAIGERINARIPPLLWAMRIHPLLLGTASFARPPKLRRNTLSRSR
jgi:ACS family tartrate transporter-like MFS transporter